MRTPLTLLSLLYSCKPAHKSADGSTATAGDLLSIMQARGLSEIYVLAAAK